jgi:hypothetical protein
LGGHKEVGQRDKRLAGGGQEGLFLKPFEAVIANVFTDDGAVFLFDETVAVLLAVPAAGEGDALFFTPGFCGVIDKFGAVISVKLQNRDRHGGSDVRESLKSPGMGLVGE